MASKGSEFGGVDGLIAPLPHELESWETATLEYRTDPMDPTADADTQRLKEAGGSISNPDGFKG